MSEKERERQADRERERKREAPERGGGGLKGPQASSNLWHGKKEELALSVSVCAYTQERKARGHSTPLFSQYSVMLLP